MGPCRVYEQTVGKAGRGVVLENDLTKIVTLPDKGADIYALYYKPQDLDVLSKTPWGLRDPGSSVPTPAPSDAVWLEYYGGGWQEIFPAGGGPSKYKGAEIGFHGESTVLPWDVEVVQETPERVEVWFRLQTYRTPFILERRVSVECGSALITLDERVTNVGEEEMHFMWGHHPAFGRPFLGEGSIIDIPAGWFEGHDPSISPNSRLAPGRTEWPGQVKGVGGQGIDIRKIPSADRRMADLGYFGGFKEGWYALTNTELGFGVGLVWPEEIFQYVWFWQEWGGSFGFPWYGRGRVTALEPWTSYPGTRLEDTIENGTARLLEAGESLEAELKVCFFESTTGVERISPSGDVTIKPKP